jgi:O-antigen/teichoic acid export membrane protein
MRRTAALLGLSHAVEYSAQLLLPVLLVRLLSPEDFGGYRLAWLLATSAATLLTLNIAHSLVYQVARVAASQHAALLGNAVVTLLLVGLLAAVAVSPWTGLSGALFDTSSHATLWFAALFVLGWVASQPYDHVALAAGQPLMQARLGLAQTVARLLLVAATAWLTRSLDAVLLALGAFAVLRWLCVLVYAFRSAAFGRPRIDLTLGVTQLRYAAAFGTGASLFALRPQIDGWIAAIRFDAVAVAVIGIAASAAPLVGIVRTAFTQAVLPSIAQAVADRRLGDALRLNRDANLHVAAVVLPAVSLLFVVAPEVISIAFTPAFAQAADPLRLYLIGYVLGAVEVSTLVQSLGYGRFVLIQGLVLTAFSAVLAVLAAASLGLAWLPLGALASAALGAALNLAYLARRNGVPWRQLQHWPALAMLCAVAVLTAAASLAALDAVLGEADHWSRLAAGCAVHGLLWLVAAASIRTLRSLYGAWWPRRWTWAS